MICVKVPATSANCCVGFDTLGMALDWFATFYFEPNPEFVIEGCPDEFKNEDNLVIVGFKKTCDYMKVDMPTLKIKKSIQIYLHPEDLVRVQLVSLRVSWQRMHGFTVN